MKRKNFWLFIIGIAILCIIIPAASGAYSSLSKKNGAQSAEKTASEQKNEAASQEVSSQSEERQEESQEPSASEKYTVQDGDSLWGIAQKFQTSVGAIKELNNLNEDALVPGQELLIPGHGTQLPTEKSAENTETRPSRSLDSSGRYVVQEGDSLWLIAEKFQKSVAVIKELNNLTSDRVLPGQTLLVSGAVRPSNLQVNSAPAAARTPSPTPKPKPVAPATPKPKSNVLETAKQYLGVPYLYGGSSPNGFDCSGFVQYVYKQHGVSLPRVASDQAGVGTKVNTPAPGDLVFFTREKGGSGGIGHVGIYAGNNTFIHANTNQGVTFTSMDSQWHNDRYAGAKRF